MDNGTVTLLIALAFVAAIGFSSYRRVRSFQRERQRKMAEKPIEPVLMKVRCEATIELGWLAVPAQCWRRRGHERFGAKHYAKKGDGTNFIAEWS